MALSLSIGPRSCVGVAAAVFCLCLAACPLRAFAANSEAERLVSIKGSLPHTGKIVIRSGLAWMSEADPLFTVVNRSLAAVLKKRGMGVVPVTPSAIALFPAGTAAVRGAPIPKNKGGVRKRVMSVAEAIARMKAMDLAREGRLPQAQFGTKGSGRTPSVALPTLSPQELIRFALSQEEGEPELRGHVTIPGRVPSEIEIRDAAIADHALTVRFAMLWPGSGIPDESPSFNPRSGLAVGWHLLEMVCYDLAPVREKKPPQRIWSAAVQRVAYDASLRVSLPGMAREALEVSP